MKTLISIVGPTAVGKTCLSLALAKKYHTEIISCDSRQMYRHMDIGTAKASTAELAEIPHHFINTLNPDEDYNAGAYEHDAEMLLQSLFSRHDTVICVGGSTLYINALWNGIDEMPEIDKGIREALMKTFESEGLPPLLTELAAADPETFAKIDRQNHARVMRALEVWRSTGKPISAFRSGNQKQPNGYQHIKIALTCANREELYARINTRVVAMFEQGLVQEVKNLLEMGYDTRCNALRSIGYQEVIAHLRGEISEARALELIQQNSRQYAKRQLTWFRRYTDITWFEGGDNNAVIDWLEERY